MKWFERSQIIIGTFSRVVGSRERGLCFLAGVLEGEQSQSVCSESHNAAVSHASDVDLSQRKTP
jgi:hypothetical protein